MASMARSLTFSVPVRPRLQPHEDSDPPAGGVATVS